MNKIIRRVAPRIVALALVFGVLAIPTAGVALADTTYSPSTDFGSTYNVARTTGARQLWDQHYSGQGIGVALIDTGVSPVAGLTGGNVVNGPDLSLDAGTPNLRHLDAFGHGTHLAGIIAGRDSGPLAYGSYTDASKFTGMAPDATLVNVKVGASDGAVDVSQVIAALDWTVAHKNDPGLNIRVINLAYGTNSTQDYRIDPLAKAVEAAWQAGIVVVTSAGNGGNTASVLTNPATDPYVLAVGADGKYDKNGNRLFVTSFSNAGNPTRSPDLVAPGQSIVSLRDPNSFVDMNFPGGRVNDAANRFFKGSGTSQATAIVSGLVADLLSKFPTMTPDQVKGVLRSNATPLPGVSPTLQGAGDVSVANLGGLKYSSVPAYTQTFPTSTGSGSLEAARGSSHLYTADGTMFTGEQTVFGVSFDGNSWSAAAWSGNSWSGNSWSGNSWSGGSWTGNSWSGNSWSGDAWTGHSWSTDIWSSDIWAGNSWSGNSWSGNSWSGNSWSGNSWSATDWGGNSWSGNSWSASDWS